MHVEAIVVFVSVVWFIFGFTHMLAYTLMEDAEVVWRSPPEVSEMPRFYQLTGQKGDRILHHRFSPWDGLTEVLYLNL